MPENAAAWLPRKQAKLEVGPAPYSSPLENEIVVKNGAVAINPVDWVKQLIGDLMFTWIKYPAILGCDVAGQVVEVGPGVTRFKVGDRVVGQALGTSQARTGPAEGGFQLYTVLVDHMASPIPDSMSYEAASVLPLAISTAACGLFQKDHLALQYPSLTPTPTGETLIVWGGSTSVGSNAIQLAVAAGYEVITTASPRNFDYVKRLGASQAFDYNSKTVAKDIIKACKGRTLAGAIAIGTGSAGPCMDIVGACKGRKFVSTASPPVAIEGFPEGASMGPRLALFLLGMMGGGASLALKAAMGGVRTKFIFGDTLADNEVGPMIYRDFLPGALAAGRYVAAPDPMVVGKGLEFVQGGVDAQRKGVSAKKVVVAL
jgi:NADPH:quinone reductase-like Zn-dependent oxidoreductase